MFSFCQPTDFSSKDPAKAFTLVHVAQLHAPVGTMTNKHPPSRWMDNNQFEHTALSQFNVAKTILANPNALVVKEGLGHDWTNFATPWITVQNRCLSTEETYETIAKNFPKGIPDNFSELDVGQKDWLIWPGAALVLFYLGAIKVVYQGESAENQKKLNDVDVDSMEYLQILFEQREMTALALARKAARESKQNNPIVLLIYGAGHFFSKRIYVNHRSFPELAYAGRVNTIPKEYELTMEQRGESIFDKKIEIGITIEALSRSITKDQFKGSVEKYKNEPISYSFSQRLTVPALQPKEKDETDKLVQTLLPGATATRRTDMFREARSRNFDDRKFETKEKDIWPVFKSAERFDKWMKGYTRPPRTDNANLIVWLSADEGAKYVQNYKQFCELATTLKTKGYSTVPPPNESEFKAGVSEYTERSARRQFRY